MNIQWAPICTIHVTYEEAAMHCAFLEYNGYRNWRLPTFDEYEYIRLMVPEYGNYGIWCLEYGDIRKYGIADGFDTKLDVVPVRDILID